MTIALSSDAFTAANGQRENLEAGEGVGLYLKGGVARAATFSTSNLTTTTQDNASTATPYNVTTGGHGLIVGRIVWGETALDDDTITLYQPDTSLNLGPVVSTQTTVVDQSTFDTLTFRWGDPVLLDEIRFGVSAADVMPIPEPSAALLGGLGLLALLRRRR